MIPGGQEKGEGQAPATQDEVELVTAETAAPDQLELSNRPGISGIRRSNAVVDLEGFDSDVECLMAPGLVDAMGLELASAGL